MPDSLLTVFKFLFLALVYAFFFRVLRAVWADLSPKAAGAAPTIAAQRSAVGAAAGRRTAPAAGATLRVLEPAGLRGTTFQVGEEATVGRAAGCQVALDDSSVSQLHARVFRRDGRLYVEDLGSTNGTYLNRKKVTAAVELRRGDRLTVGRTVLEVAR